MSARSRRIGRVVPPDAIEFLEAFNAMSRERQRAMVNCIASFAPTQTANEKILALGIALGHSEHVIQALIAPPVGI